MIIIETCPKCGHDLIDSMICTYPPVTQKYCPSCGWTWEGKREEIARVPFTGKKMQKYELNLDKVNSVDDCKKILNFLCELAIEPLPEGIEYNGFSEVKEYFTS